VIESLLVPTVEGSYLDPKTVSLDKYHQGLSHFLLVKLG